MKPKIDFNEYEPVYPLDAEEQQTWDDLKAGKYVSIDTPEVRKKYTEIFKNGNYITTTNADAMVG